jgi:SlyX protein
VTDKIATDKKATDKKAADKKAKNITNETIEQMKVAIEQLEFKVAYQEDNFEQMNEIITNQQFTIDRQMHLLKGVVDKIKTMQVADPETGQGDDLPPHY